MLATASPQYDVERAQAVVRLVIAPIAIGYTLVMHLRSAIDPTLAGWILLLESLFLAASLALWNDIRRRPGNHPVRRVLTMLSDYTCITLTIAIGGEPMLPVYAILIWVTVGYGLRYGSSYLLLATVLATLSLLIIASVSTYWQSQPYLIITLLLTTLMVPAYMHALLKRSRLAAEAEQAANRAKSQFLAQASHDLRQPIHSISLFTACLRDSSLDGEQHRLVENIDKSLNSVAQLFRTILDMYSLDSGKVVAHLEPVPLQGLLRQLIQQNTEAARWAGVEIRLHCPNLYVHVDQGLLTTMLQNLLTNALKYAPGQPMLIGCRRRGATLSIEFYDKGRGIAEAHLENIFEEFYRVRQARDSDVEGMGLGLTIVRRLGKLMDLQVRIRSVEGKGTLAAIDGLQLASAPAAQAPVQSARPQAQSMLNGLRVCLIEDDQNVLLATATLLKKWGCVVDTYTSLPDVAADIDLVVTDFDLGLEASGADCIAHVRALAARQVPAIIMTGHDVRRVQEAVGDDEIPILSKPVQPAELRSLLVALKLKAKVA
ncbi:hybrid sensor histidine kinase/response regulator [Pseudomonas sp. URMO17WK12:I2]|uniref:hybrid sensor histidine kinase/response regulator n=1 Tax=Pseudomonas sp. URMO17WK12:I2 TaxID=1261623 RepID=UPI000DAF4657|nr:hybrid sensor histidine kinase/response regulator [Pseudomonas sp. URMO17WK12:I2]PZW49684.1 signal transduction histidine kinase [Pseudomonas sp. URMO17WK12:I2]